VDGPDRLTWGKGCDRVLGARVGCSSVCAEGGAGCGTRGGRGSLPCVDSETHGNGFFFAVCFRKDARQRFLCRAFFNRAYGKSFFYHFLKFIKNSNNFEKIQKITTN
jgi:hypothetical protein